MTDGFAVGQVDSSDPVGAEEDAPAAVAVEGADADALAAKGLGHLPQSPLEAHVVLAGGDGAHDVTLAILRGRQPPWHRARARPVAAGRHFEVERLVRPLEVVDLAPAVEGALHLGQVMEAPQREHLLGERAMEALVLAAALG